MYALRQIHGFDQHWRHGNKTLNDMKKILIILLFATSAVTAQTYSTKALSDSMRLGRITNKKQTDDITGIKGRNTTQDNSIIALQKVIATQNTLLSETNKRLDTLQASVNKINNDINIFYEAIPSLKNQIGLLFTSDSETAVRFAGIESLLTGYRNQVASFMPQLVETRTIATRASIEVQDIITFGVNPLQFTLIKNSQGVYVISLK